MKTKPQLTLFTSAFTSAFICTLICIILFTATNSFAEKKDTFETSMPKFEKLDFKKDATYITSDNLTLNAKERIFIYTGNVDVKHKNMVLTSDKVTGYYSKDNKIEKLVAVGKVDISQGNMRARSEEAIYDAVKKIIVLTKNPELEKDKSLLSADEITIFIDEERSTAKGQVRVKLLQ
ncbi:MAG: lipopolysaccharide transport periplasmic protein LptA [Bdellovibrionota bacterium]